MTLILKYVTVLMVLAAPALAQDIRVIDGDTFEWNGEVIQIWGIDAPELGQTCLDRALEPPQVFDAGELAAYFLEHNLRGGLTDCVAVETNGLGHTVARCSVPAITTAGSLDLGWLMVRSGVAWDDATYSDGQYAMDQRIAEERLSGVWEFDCESPWAWRRNNVLRTLR